MFSGLGFRVYRVKFKSGLGIRVNLSLGFRVKGSGGSLNLGRAGFRRQGYGFRGRIWV